MHIPKQTVLPRWRGFNMVGMFHRRTNPAQEECDDDYKLIADLGFDFIRIPCSYRRWASPEDPFTIREEGLAYLDHMIDLCLQNGLHANLCLHRIPGYCINDDEPVKEKGNLFTDADIQDAAVFQWQMLAERYKDISCDKLSFNVVNEPEHYVTMWQYKCLINRVLDTVRSITPDRLVIVDGMMVGDMPPVLPMIDHARENIGFSCRGYTPRSVTHYTRYFDQLNQDVVWPGGYEFTRPISTQELEDMYGAWAALGEHLGLGIHCGEMGCINTIPHSIALAWLEDVLRILTRHNIGYAMWHFAGSFSIADSGRTDAEYVKMGHRMIDKKMLEILQKY